MGDNFRSLHTEKRLIRNLIKDTEEIYKKCKSKNDKSEIFHRLKIYCTLYKDIKDDIKNIKSQDNFIDIANYI